MVSSDVIRAHVWVQGHVQGVGFRWWTRSRALELGLVGSARVRWVGPDEEISLAGSQIRGQASWWWLILAVSCSIIGP